MIGTLYIGNVKVDLEKSIPFPLSYSIADFKNPEKRKRSRSKTVDLPGTRLNKQVFAAAFSLTLAPDNPFNSVANFDPAARTVGRYYIGGVLVFDGLVKLNKISIMGDHYTFNITLFSNVVNVIKELDKVKVSELNWSEYTHQLTLDNIRKSWDESVMVGADSDGTGGTLTPNFSGSAQTGFPNGYPEGWGYVYPIAEYGYERPDATTFKANNLLPMLYVREVLFKMFETHDVGIDCDLFDTPLFRRFVCGISPGEKRSLTPEEIAEREVDAASDVDIEEVLPHVQTAVNGPGIPVGPGVDIVVNWNFRYRYEKQVYKQLLRDLPATQVTVNTDDLGALDVATGSVTIQRTGQYKFTLGGLLRAGVRYDDTLPSGALGIIYSYEGFFFGLPGNSGNDAVGVAVYRNGNMVYQQFTNINNIASGNDFINVNYQGDFTLNVNAGDVIDVKFVLIFNVGTRVVFPSSPNQPQEPPPPDVWVEVDSNSSTLDFNMESLDSELGDGDPILLNRFAPEMSCGQFFKGIVTAFNLYVDDPDPVTAVIRMSALTDYYLPNTQAIDWTEKVDHNKTFDILPASTIQGELYRFKFKDADDLENERYRKTWGIGYGNRNYEVPNTFVTGDRVFELPFQQSVPVALGGTSLIAPRIVDDEGEPYKGDPRIYAYNGLVDLEAPDELHVTMITTPETNPIEESFYPCINHQDSLTAPTFDFMWSPALDYWQGWNGALTNNNLWTYHKQFIFELTQSSSAIVRCYVRLNASDIYLLNFARLVKLSGVLYRLNEVKDWDINNYASTQIELLKVITDG